MSLYAGDASPTFKLKLLNDLPCCEVKGLLVLTTPNLSFIIYGRRCPRRKVPVVVVLEEKPNPSMGKQRTLVILARTILSTVPILTGIGEITTRIIKKAPLRTIALNRNLTLNLPFTLHDRKCPLGKIPAAEALMHPKEMAIQAIIEEARILLQPAPVRETRQCMLDQRREFAMMVNPLRSSRPPTSGRRYLEL
jgi:hypothetical protein